MSSEENLNLKIIKLLGSNLTHLEKNKIGVDSLKKDHKEIIILTNNKDSKDKYFC